MRSHLLWLILNPLIYQVRIESSSFLVEFSHLIQLSLQIMDLLGLISQRFAQLKERFLLSLSLLAEIPKIPHKSIIADRVNLSIKYFIPELRVNGLIWEIIGRLFANIAYCKNHRINSAKCNVGRVAFKLNFIFV